MEPLNEKELTELLRQWKAPEAPQSLEARLLPQRPSWWRWLFTGTIRVPVPVGIVAAVVLALWLLSGEPTPVTAPPPAAGVSLADFQPVEQLEPKVVEDTQAEWGREGRNVWSNEE